LADLSGLVKKSESALLVDSTNLGFGVGRGLRSGFGAARGLGLGAGFSVFLETLSSLSRSSSILGIKWKIG
jgi:hypothetical protein